MLNARRTIDKPAYEYIHNDVMAEEVKEFERK